MIRSALAFALLLAVQPAPRAARISGRVVDATTGRPLAGVVITLNGSALPFVARSRPPRVLTGRDGTFAIRGLASGVLYLNASRFGYLDATLGQTRPLGSTQPLRIRNGADIHDVALKMWRPAVIAGAVLDEAGEPIVGAQVRAYARVLAAGKWRFDPAGLRTTDDRGEYRLAPLTPGDYVVSVTSKGASVPANPAGTARGNRLLVYPRVFFPDATVTAGASMLHLRSGEERNSVDLRLHPSPARRVSGIVVSAAGPVANAPIQLFPASVSNVSDPMEATATATDGDGNFNFEGVASGAYVVRLVTVLRPPAGDDTLAAAFPIEVSARDVDGLVVPASAGPRVSGRVEFDGLGDAPDPSRVAGIRIALEPVDGVPLPDRLSFESAKPTADGTFRTAGVPPGRYLLRVNNQIDGWTLRGATVGGRDLTDMPFDLHSDLKDVVLTFSDRLCTIAGTVRTDQLPDPNAVVIAFPTDTSAWTDNGISQRRLRTTRASADGSYALPPLPPGEYYVAAVREDSIAEPYDPPLLAALAVRAPRVTLHEGEARMQDLRTMTPR